MHITVTNKPLLLAHIRARC